MSGYDVFDPFMTVFRELERNGDPRDPRGEVEALTQREELIAQLLRGGEDLEIPLDCLSDQRIDPDAWVDQVIDNIEYVIDSGIRFVSNHHGILLPESYMPESEADLLKRLSAKGRRTPPAVEPPQQVTKPTTTTKTTKSSD